MKFKVAAYFMRISSGNSYQHISELLGIGVSTAIWQCWQVAQAIDSVYGYLISEARYERSLGAIQEQFSGYGWRGVAGAIDCTHVKVTKPVGARGRRWRDRNKQFSTIVQAVTGPDLKFYDVFVGFSGAAHD